MADINSWGRIPCEAHSITPITDRRLVNQQIQQALPGLPYGMGRSYGDVCLNPGGNLWLTKSLDRFINFDETSGLIVCEAGVLLRDIQRLTVPRGWILPVTPGTQMATVGGAIANDVHGKNHHIFGAFGDHIRKIQLHRTDGTLISCGPDSNAEWFSATVGGLGLTGLIVQVEIQLKRIPGPFLETETIAFTGLDQFFDLSDHSEAHWEHAVSWIDCLSGPNVRGIFMRGRPCVTELSHEKPRNPISVPFVPPVSLVNTLTLMPFNTMYYNLKKWQSGSNKVHYEPFFYPLDNLHHWNRMYGPKGFYQYQSVVPRAVGKEAIQAMLEAISKSGEGSFLAVLKTFGQRKSVGMLSFPMTGVTLALDFPNRGQKTVKLFNDLDHIVKEASGRLYMAKDARMPRDLFEAGYPRLTEFINYRDKGISSAMSRRLMGS